MAQMSMYKCMYLCVEHSLWWNAKEETMLMMVIDDDETVEKRISHSAKEL